MHDMEIFHVSLFKIFISLKEEVVSPVEGTSLGTSFGVSDIRSCVFVIRSGFDSPDFETVGQQRFPKNTHPGLQ